MPAINTIKGLAPGKIVYHVYGSSLIKNKESYSDNPEEHITKLILTSFPKFWHRTTGTRCNSLFFDVIRCGYMGEYESCHSVLDCAIGDTFRKYNLNRIFSTKEEALEFVSECLIGKFFDSTDQEVYDRDFGYNDDECDFL